MFKYKSNEIIRKETDKHKTNVCTGNTWEKSKEEGNFYDFDLMMMVDEP